jgi:hypothetical protein
MLYAITVETKFVTLLIRRTNVHKLFPIWDFGVESISVPLEFWCCIPSIQDLGPISGGSIYLNI